MTSVGLEIERRFLLARIDDGAMGRARRVLDIRQAYLTRGSPAVRVRESDGAYRMAVKDGEGLVRREVEFAVAAETAAALFEIAGDHVIRKTRYEIGRWEVDVFKGRFEGLLVAEVELESEEEPLPELPSGVEPLCELTGHLGFTNQYLAWLAEAEARTLVRDLLLDHAAALAGLDGYEAAPGG